MQTFSSAKTLLMGIINATDDSFSGDGIGASVDAAVAQAIQMEKDGADMLDIGAESSRRFSIYYDVNTPIITPEEEITKLLPIIKAVKNAVKIPISIDTYKASVTRACLEAGVDMINDIKGLEDPEMISVIKDFQVPVVIMHMKIMANGEWKMDNDKKVQMPESLYGDVVQEVKDFLRERFEKAKNAGIETIFIDPGIGFGKTTQDSLKLLKHLKEFTEIGPVLVGTSRKSFIGQTNGNIPPNERLPGTLASLAVSVMNGAKILRVHDVKEAKQSITIVEAILQS